MAQRSCTTRVVIRYDKLWKLLIDKKMRRTDLVKYAGIGTATLAKLGKDKQVSLDTLVRISAALDCDIGDIVDLTRRESFPEK